MNSSPHRPRLRSRSTTQCLQYACLIDQPISATLSNSLRGICTLEVRARPGFTVVVVVGRAHRGTSVDIPYVRAPMFLGPTRTIDLMPEVCILWADDISWFVRIAFLRALFIADPSVRIVRKFSFVPEAAHFR